MKEKDCTSFTALIAHSNKAQRTIIKEAISIFKIKTIEAQSPAQSRKMNEEFNPNIILLEEPFQGFDNASLCQELTSQNKDFPCSVITIVKNSSHKFLDFLMQAGAVDFVEEPIHLESFRKRFASILRYLRTSCFLFQSHKQLLEQKRMETIGIFATGMAHNFNNIFANIMATTELLKLTCSENKKVMQAAETISNATFRGAELTSSLVSFAALASSTKTMTCNNPYSVLNEVTNLFNRMDKIGASYILESKEDLNPIKISTADFSKVILELIRNASNAISHGGTVTTRASEEYSAVNNSKFLRITIEDNGKGIPEDKLENLFIPFYQVHADDPSIQVALDGTGLGLTTCYNILKSVGGTIEVENTSETGTSISFTLPLTTK